MRLPRIYIFFLILVFVLILAGSGAFMEPRSMDHEKCKESFISYMLFGECTLRDGFAPEKPTGIES